MLLVGHRRHAGPSASAGPCASQPVPLGSAPGHQVQLVALGSGAISAASLRLAGGIWGLQRQRLRGGPRLPLHPKPGGTSSPAKLREGMDRPLEASPDRIRSSKSLWRTRCETIRGWMRRGVPEADGPADGEVPPAQESPGLAAWAKNLPPSGLVASACGGCARRSARLGAEDRAAQTQRARSEGVEASPEGGRPIAQAASPG